MQRRNSISRYLFVLLGAALCLAGGCNPGNPGGGGSAIQDGPDSITSQYSGGFPIRIVCTTGMVADLVRYVGGPQVAVIQLMGAGVDPHLYKSSPGDIRQLSEADLIFYSGRNLEGKMGEAFRRMAASKPTIALSDHILLPTNLNDLNQTHDPHLWMDVGLWRSGVEIVAKSLARFDPTHAEEYERRAREYRAELTDLDEWVRRQVELIPPDQRLLVTAHDAFRYFGRAYGVEVRAIQGLSTESEGSVKVINNLVDLLVSRGIPAVFVESSVSEKNVLALVEGCRARGHDLAIGGELYSDALGPEGTRASTYLGMIRHNVETIVKALRK